MIIYGKINGGQFKPQRFYEQEYKKMEGKEVELQESDTSKTAQQLRYLWGVVYPIVSDYTGFTKEEVSQTYKDKFLTYEKSHKNKIYKFTKGLSELKKKEMAEFIDKVVKHARNELELIIPEADPEFSYPE